MKRYLYTLLIVSFINFPSYSQESTPFNLSPDFKENNIHNLEFERISGSIVSITETSSGVFIACNYGSLFKIDTLNKKIEIIKKPLGLKTWNPTGVFFNKRNKTLYLANYTAHNILCFKLKDDDSLVLESEITFPGLSSPENVSVTDDGSLIAIADYDAEKIFLVNQKGQVQWSYPVKLAHGVCVEPDGSAVYALGLDTTEAQIYKFNKKGKLLVKNGLPTYQKEINFYTYATHCALSPKGELFYLDAHIGGLVSVNKETLLHNKIIGTYGPAFNQINVSYGYAWKENGNILLADMYKGRLLEIEPNKNEILFIYTYHDYENEKKDLYKGVNLDKKQIYTNDTINISKEFYLNVLPKNIPLCGWMPGYKGIINKNHPIQFSVRADQNIFKKKFLRFVELRTLSFTDRIYSIVSSPQSPYAIIIKEGLGFPVYVGDNFWLEKAEITEISNIAGKVEKNIESYYSYLKQKEDPLKALYACFFNEIYENFDEFIKLFSTTFSTTEAKEMATKILNSKDKNEVDEVYGTYISSLENKRTVHLEEILLMNLLKHTSDVRLNGMWNHFINYLKKFIVKNENPILSSQNDIEVMK